MFGRRHILGAGAALAGAAALPARAQDRANTILIVAETAPNALDTEVVGANRAVYEVVWNCYDRLIGFGTRTDANGNVLFDDRNLRPELAESWVQTDKSVTFTLRRDATFHDGTPVTAHDVKWSFDRALGVGGYPKFIFNSVSLTRPEQFVAVDDHTFRLDFDKPDNFTMPYLASPVGFVLNAALVRSHATEKDPWGLEWTRANTAGSGAYTVQSFKPGQELICQRNPNWRSGKPPAIQRIILRTVPDAGSRRALLERGDADISFDMPPKDAADLASVHGVTVISTPMDNNVTFLAMNVNTPPFDNPKVRHAISYAVPYEAIVRLALFGRARALDGGPPQVTTPVWPQPGPYTTDPARAKALLAEAGYPDGFETTLSYDLSNAAINEPLCVLLQDSLAAIGVRASLNKVPGANWRTQLASRKMPFLVHTFGGWLAAPYMYFGFVYYENAGLHDAAAYETPRMRQLIDISHYSADSAAVHAAETQYIQLAFDDLPMIPLFQPTFNVGTRQNIGGIAYWFFRQLDYRLLTKA